MLFARQVQTVIERQKQQGSMEGSIRRKNNRTATSKSSHTMQICRERTNIKNKTNQTNQTQQSVSLTVLFFVQGYI